jgi:hypothetical protein
MSQIILVEQATPATPSAGQHKLYPKSDGYFYMLDATGSERRINFPFVWRGDWSAGTYNLSDLVRNSAKVWVCIAASTTEEPTGTPTDWEVFAEDGAIGPTGPAIALSFISDTDSTADSDPGNGLFKWNHATQASATVLYFDDQTADAVSLATYYGQLGDEGFIYMVQGDDLTKWQLWKWTAAIVDGAGYRKFTVALMANGGAIVDNKTVYVTFVSAGGAGGGASAFTDLSDVPTTYASGAGKSVVVNGTEDGLEFDHRSIQYGTTFAGMNTGKLVYRTDRKLLYFYDGTRWLTVQEYVIPLAPANGATDNRSSTFASAFRAAAFTALYDMWLERMLWTSYVSTTNNSSNYWSYDLQKAQQSVDAISLIVSATTQSDTPSRAVSHVTNISALLGTDFSGFRLDLTKVGSPGNLFSYGPLIIGRLVG